MRSGVRTVELKDKKAGFKQVNPYANAFALPESFLLKSPKPGSNPRARMTGKSER
jgi:hypothetical protein